MPADTVLEVQSAIRPNGWFWCENAIFDLAISGHAKLVYLFLKRAADDKGESYYSHKSIAGAISASVRSVQYAMDELVSRELVSLQSRQGTRQPNLYTVRPVTHAPAARVETTPAPGADIVRTGCRHSTQPVPSQGLPKEGLPKEGHTLRQTGYDLKARSILAFLNRKADRHYQPTKINLGYIIGRLKEGATEDQCLGVIAMRVRKWKDDSKMREYLRPETLFGPGKFSQYQGELPAEAFSEQEVIHA